MLLTVLAGGEGKKGKEGGPPTHSATHTASLSDESWKGENGSGLTDAAGDKADPISSSFSDSNGFSLSLSLSLSPPLPSFPLPSLTFLPSFGMDMRLADSILTSEVRPSRTKVARWQNLIPSFPWIAPGWRAWGRNPRKGRDQMLQCSIAEP